MEKTAIYDKIKALITPYVSDEQLLSDLNAGTRFIQDLDINSAHFIDVILDFEDEFDVIIDDESVTEMETVGQAVEILNSLLVESV